MSSTPVDVFASFAVRCQLQLRIEPLAAAPRDVLAPPDDADQVYLVTITKPSSGTLLRSVFIKSADDPLPPDARDVLWWLAADAWAVRHSGRDLRRWAQEYRYPPDAEATGRLFEQHLAQNDALERLLGHAEYERLLALYDAEIARVRKA